MMICGDMARMMLVLVAALLPVAGGAGALQPRDGDALGRLVTAKLPGETVGYGYNVRDALTSISSPRFSQQLRYAAGAAAPCYNGNIAEAVTQGNKYAYDNANSYKYGGKEFDTFGGTDLYDFHARYHAPSTGRYGLVDEDGNEYKGNDKFAKAVVNALRMLQKGDNGNRLVLAAIESTNQMRISEVNEKHPDNLFQEHKNGDITIWWNPNKKAAGYSEFWRGDGTSISMSFVGLGHEIAHGIDFWYGDYDNNIWLDYGVSGKVYCADIFACHYENLIRAEHSLPIRTHYARYSNGNPIENSRIAYRMGLLPQSFINIHPLKKITL